MHSTTNYSILPKKPNSYWIKNLATKHQWVWGCGGTGWGCSIRIDIGLPILDYLWQRLATRCVIAIFIQYVSAYGPERSPQISGNWPGPLGLCKWRGNIYIPISLTPGLPGRVSTIQTAFSKGLCPLLVLCTWHRGQMGTECCQYLVTTWSWLDWNNHPVSPCKDVV